MKIIQTNHTENVRIRELETELDTARLLLMDVLKKFDKAGSDPRNEVVLLIPEIKKWLSKNP